MSFVSYAQNFEDVMLWRALKTVDKGVYVDIGAQDPTIDSVSLAFYERGWKGVHAEPTEHYACALKRERLGDEVHQVAIGRQDGIAKFYEFENTGLSTGDPLVADQQQRRGYPVKETSVEVITLDALLAPLEGTTVHWMKIDVEGMEGDVVAGWKRSTVRPWILIVESSRPSTQENVCHQWESGLIHKGYRFVYFDGVNRFYLSNEHSELTDAFSAPPNVFDEFSLSGKASHAFCNQLHHKVHLTELRAAEAEKDAYQSNLRVKTLMDSLQYTEQQLRNSEEALHKRCQEYEQQLNLLTSSRSWRLMAPLRGLAFRFRQLRSAFRSKQVSRHFLDNILNRPLQWSARHVAGNPHLKKFALSILKRSPWLFERLVRRLKSLDPQSGSTRHTVLPASQKSLTARARRLHRKLNAFSATESR
ncbi:FkbM family methyltransferase [Modicisalibacter tunisiensis]|uniref:FkbM family methyltransferase n=1 Tax=Modicisalibacter tunisiensis TaxID=390637 RepID=A0ABS7WU44_9GAMM|nr:FkbM family methyltransferase [Modicisalibacter tunisiensis]MBZ9566131.1 FkbM family methyltransferase [Modicisalibacter tunisiensis]